MRIRAKEPYASLLVALGARRVDEKAKPHPAADTTALDGAMHSVWLHGNWRWLTRNMTTEEREAAADAVERHWAAYDDDERVDEVTLADLRWWRK